MEDGVGQRAARQQEAEGQVRVCYPGHKGLEGDRPKPLHEDAHLHGLIPKGVWKVETWLSPTWGCHGGTSAGGSARHWTCVGWTRASLLCRPALLLSPGGLGSLQE